uniref:Uncharacterized protein n=2 Tax=Oryza sativa subsp. japonica TaxID=39947 RepID=Q8S7X6_ORYSJ|nr:Hypothetical protein [Oryza sativa Japonica Group]AAP51830.1 hypothetical protein LOC_Os10g02140 [Oryza sativa Japonica Group]
MTPGGSGGQDPQLTCLGCANPPPQGLGHTGSVRRRASGDFEHGADPPLLDHWAQVTSTTSVVASIDDHDGGSQHDDGSGSGALFHGQCTDGIDIHPEGDGDLQ